MYRLTPLLLASLLSCKPTAEADPVDTSPPEFEFSFVVLADPHIAGPLDHEERLATAVEWVNANASERSIELVFIVGDIGWGEGLATANALLSDLEVPWIPIIGDNEIHFGDEQNWDTVFEPQFEELAATLDFERGQVEVEEDGKTLYLQNHVLNHRGLRWVGLDWCSRSESNLLSEFAELHDTPGGSLPFLSGLLGQLEVSAQEDVLLFSHHPMHLGMFDTEEMLALTDLTGPLEGRVAGAYAGHVHLNAEVAVEDGGYTVWATDATWDDENTVRIVEVSANASTHVYTQELVVLD